MNKSIKRSSIAVAFTWFILHFIIFYLPQVIVGDAERIVVGSWIDDRIPLIPFFVLFYAMAYVQWIVNLFVIVRENDDKMLYNYFSSDLVGKIVCAILFIAIPTTMVQPVFESTDLWTFHLNLVYALDEPVNLFPSMHCFESYICARVALQSKKSSKFYKVFSVVLALLVFASTVFTKQHILIDIPAGIILAELSVFIISRGWLPEVMARLFSSLDVKKDKQENIIIC